MPYASLDQSRYGESVQEPQTMSQSDPTKSTRRHERYEVDIPCQISWKETPFNGRIANLSLGGVQITQATAIPPKGALVEICFEFNSKHFAIDARLDSRVVYSIPRMLDEGGAGYFGVQFDESPEGIGKKFSYIFESLAKRPREVDWKLVYPLGRCNYCEQWSSMVCTTCDHAPYVCDDCTTRHLETHLSS